jgi:hypothetical protein
MTGGAGEAQFDHFRGIRVGQRSGNIRKIDKLENYFYTPFTPLPPLS